MIEINIRILNDSSLTSSVINELQLKNKITNFQILLKFDTNSNLFRPDSYSFLKYLSNNLDTFDETSRIHL